MPGAGVGHINFLSVTKNFRDPDFLIFSAEKISKNLSTPARKPSSWLAPLQKRFAYLPGAGVEPARPYGHKILSLACLPIPPPGRFKFKIQSRKF